MGSSGLILTSVHTFEVLILMVGGGAELEVVPLFWGEGKADVDFAFPFLLVEEAGFKIASFFVACGEAELEVAPHLVAFEGLLHSPLMHSWAR